MAVSLLEENEMARDRPLEKQQCNFDKQQRLTVSLHPALVVAAALVLIGYAATQSWVVRSGLPGTDYRYYIDASRSILNGKSPYAEGWWYIYPPPLAVMLIPLAGLPHLVGYAIWTLIGIVAYAYAVYRSGWAGQCWWERSGCRPTTPSITGK